MVPDVGLMNPAVILRSVVFPQPDGPSKVVKVPASNLQLTLSTAVVSLNFFVIFILLCPVITVHIHL